MFREWLLLIGVAHGNKCHHSSRRLVVLGVWAVLFICSEQHNTITLCLCPCKLMERGQWMLQTSCGLQPKYRTQRASWNEFPGRAAASKPYITKCNAKRRMQWCKKLLEEWSKIPINTLLILVDSLPRRVEAVIAAKGGPTSYWTLWVRNGMALTVSSSVSQGRWANTLYLIWLEVVFVFPVAS